MPKPTATPSPTRTFTPSPTPLGLKQNLSSAQNGNENLAWSPDGKKLAYIAAYPVYAEFSRYVNAD